MMIRHFIYYMPIVISIIGVLSINLTLKNKDRNNNRLIIVFNILNILYLFIISLLIHNLLPIIVDLTILVTWLISIIGGVLYFISTIICICKRKKLNENTENKLSIKIFILILLTPIIIFTLTLCKEVYLINNSKFIVAYNSAGNGGIGDTYDFVYVISDKICKEISIDVDLSYKYYNKIFLPKKLKEITKNELQNKGYRVVIENKYINVYKNNNLIHKKKLNERYFNTKLDSVFYND